MNSFVGSALVIVLGLSTGSSAFALDASGPSSIVLSPAQAKAVELENILTEMDNIQNQISSARSTRNIVVTISATVGAVAALGTALGFMVTAHDPLGRTSKLFSYSLGAFAVASGTGGLTIYLKNDAIDGFQAQLQNARARHAAALVALQDLGITR